MDAVKLGKVILEARRLRKSGDRANAVALLMDALQAIEDDFMRGAIARMPFD